MPGPDLFDRPLLLVSGKGGTGKTVVAAACAMAASRSGRRVLLAEVEGRNGLAELLGIDPPGFRERPTRFGFSVLSVTPREALLEYLWLFFRMRTLARTLQRARVLEVATEAVPGFRDLMVAGKLYELTEWRRSSPEARRRPHYDLVVVDAPPTGQLLPLLESPSGFRDLLRVGRPHRQLAGIDRMLRRQCRVALVATPEELPVQEIVEAVEALGGAGFPHGPVVANQVITSPFPRGTRSAAVKTNGASMASALKRMGMKASSRQGQELLDAAREEDDRAARQAAQLKRLGRAGPIVKLPLLYSAGFGADQVAQLADRLAP